MDSIVHRSAYVICMIFMTYHCFHADVCGPRYVVYLLASGSGANAYDS